MSERDCGRAIHAVLEAVTEKVRGAVVTRERSDHGELVFTHPLHNALCKVLVEPPSQAAGVQTTTIAVMVADWAVLSGQYDAVQQLLRINAHLMTGAVAILPMDTYEQAVVYVRRLPTVAMRPADVLGTVDDLVWEWAQSGGATIANVGQREA